MQSDRASGNSGLNDLCPNIIKQDDKCLCYMALNTQTRTNLSLTHNRIEPKYSAVLILITPRPSSQHYSASAAV